MAYMVLFLKKLVLVSLFGLTTFTVFLVFNSPPNPVQENDYNTLIGIPFNFVHVPICNKANSFLILVHTSPRNIERRKVLRETWAGTNRTDIDVLFVTGKPEKLADDQKLQKEILQHNNFIQGDFLDTYHNLTYKHVMGLKYVFYHCPNIEFVVKVDDDVFVNTHVLEKFFSMYKQKFGNDNKILCSKRVGHPVLRNGKWGVDKKEYPNSTYPPHCLGFAVVYSRKSVEQLYPAAQKMKYFWIDDVHVTGTVAEAAEVKQIDISGLSMNPNELNLIMSNRFRFDIRPVLFGPPETKSNNIQKLYKFTDFLRMWKGEKSECLY